MGLNRFLRNEKVNWISSVMSIIFSAFVYALGVVLFISTSKLMASGVSGISLIIGRVIEGMRVLPFNEAQISGVLYFIINIPVLFLSFKKFSLRFSILTIIHLVFTSLFTSLLNAEALLNIIGVSVNWPLEHQLECALFAGVLCGFSTAISYLVGGSSAGVDVIATYLNNKNQISVGRINAIVNGLIILVAISLWHKDGQILNALFTLIFIFIYSAVIDLIFVTNKKVIVTIITEKGDEIANMINVKFTRGVTRMKAFGNYSKRDKDFLYIACTSMEALEISQLAISIDEHSFTSISTAQRISGYFLNKHALKKNDYK